MKTKILVDFQICISVPFLPQIQEYIISFSKQRSETFTEFLKPLIYAMSFFIPDLKVCFRALDLKTKH